LVLSIANDNCPGQVVISGHIKALEEFESNYKEIGGKMIKRLAVSVACHTTLMGLAQEEFNLFLEKVSLERAKVPVYANTTAKAITSPEDIKTELRQQLCGPIKWRQSIQRMHNEGVGYYIELGPGKVLSGLGRRIIPGSHGINFGKCEELEKVCEIICGQ
jgi:[acyl-carrier-protein] S-malonyltransferase